jgi:high frequency lysogenization protein
MEDPYLDRTLAFAAVFQAGALVATLAKTGSAPERNIKTSLESLFVFDPQCTEEIFGGAAEFRYGLNLGLSTVKDIVDRKRRLPRADDLVEYAVSLLHLQAHLKNNPDMLRRIGERLRGLQPQVTALGAVHPDVIAEIAAIYQSTLSTLRYRVHVRGERQYLENPIVANQVRALLLAGVRAAILWHQLGGRRWQIPFTRKRMLKALDALS